MARLSGAHSPKCWCHSNSHCGCATESRFPLKPLRSQPSVMESPRNTTLVALIDLATKLVCSRCRASQRDSAVALGRLSRGSCSLGPAAGGQDGHSSSRLYASGESHDQVLHDGNGWQLHPRERSCSITVTRSKQAMKQATRFRVRGSRSDDRRVPLTGS